ncbi:jg27063 [Pararge aegeria aegeria]|uniref:Jg27063 protein n=1 Tax=Pararge aegeria aegeria TaxID=348720 RepID=A0A8S4SGY2_9NEOP|nr:jg27063 [Pararge aegeria aegeria]
MIANKGDHADHGGSDSGRSAAVTSRWHTTHYYKRPALNIRDNWFYYCTCAAAACRLAGHPDREHSFDLGLYWLSPGTTV